jgi:trans-aconitate methyltransferase
MPDFDRRHFDSMYKEDHDPWNYENSSYEDLKYSATLNILPKKRYANGLELGCSIGVLTNKLSQICDALTSVDTSGNALALAAKRCTNANVSFVRAHLPEGNWETSFDLLVLSEILYFLKPEAITILAAKLKPLAKPGADVVLVHWTGKTNYPMTADDATNLMRDLLPVKDMARMTHPKYRLDLWRFS